MSGERADLCARVLGADLCARVLDAVRKSDRGEPAVLPFLSPAERKRAERILAEAGESARAWFWGGYPDAERASLFLLPEYLLAALPAAPSACPADDVLALLGEDAANSVTALRVTGSGFRTLTHRDYLGSILALGLERTSLGDLAVQNDHEAVVFTTRTIAGFLKEDLKKVASDTVSCRDYVPDAAFTDGKKWQPLRETVASLRLDCVVAALTGFSRAQAQELIRIGSVEADFEVETRADLPLTPPVAVSVRGSGRFELLSSEGENRHGRIRIAARKLI